jgi:hypothetical protein
MPGLTVRSTRSWRALAILVGLVLLLGACRTAPPTPSSSPTPISAPSSSAIAVDQTAQHHGRAALTALGFDLAPPPGWLVVDDRDALSKAWVLIPEPYRPFLMTQVPAATPETFRIFALDPDPAARAGGLPENLAVSDLGPTIPTPKFAAAATTYGASIPTFYTLVGTVVQNDLPNRRWPVTRYTYVVRQRQAGNTLDVAFNQYLVDGPDLLLVSFTTSPWQNLEATANAVLDRLDPLTP